MQPLHVTILTKSLVSIGMSSASPNSILSRRLDLSERVIESSLDGIVVFDNEFKLVVWNPAMEVVTGIHRQDVLGHNALVLFPFLRKIGAEKHFQSVLA